MNNSSSYCPKKGSLKRKSTNSTRSHSSSPEERRWSSSELTDGWESVEKAIGEILAKSIPTIRFENVYRAVYKMVNAKRGEQLYLSYREIVTDHLEKVNAELLSGSFQEDDHTFAGKFASVVTDFLTALAMIRDILAYLDRVFIPPAKLPSIYDTGLLAFRENILHDCQVKTILLRFFSTELAELKQDKFNVETRKTFLEVIDLLKTLNDDSFIIGPIRQFEDMTLASTKSDDESHHKSVRFSLALDEDDYPPIMTPDDSSSSSSSSVPSSPRSLTPTICKQHKRVKKPYKAATTVQGSKP